MDNGSNQEVHWHDRFVVSLNCRVVFPDRPRNSSEKPELVVTRVLSVSATEMAAELVAQPGEVYVANVQHLGKLAGTVTSATAHASVLEIQANAVERRGLAAKIVWLKRHHKHQAKEERAKSRAPQATRPAFLYSDSEEIACAIKDISLSGVGIRLTDRALSVGTRLAVGTVPIQIVRVFEGGFGARFLSPLNPSNLDQIYVRL